jgi:hypothetical protein
MVAHGRGRKEGFGTLDANRFADFFFGSLTGFLLVPE